MGELDADEKALLVSGKNFYEITFKNHGGLVMPLTLNSNLKMEQLIFTEFSWLAYERAHCD